MGQYFVYGLKNGKQAVKPAWAKMTEHSYVMNEAVSILYYTLCDESYKAFLGLAKGSLLGQWRNKSVVHCGDYSNIKVGKSDLYEKLSERARDFMNDIQMDVLGKIVSDDRWLSDAADGMFEQTLDRLFQGIPLYAVNHTKKSFIDVRAQIFMHRVLESEKPGELWGMFDPLSFLLVETDSGGGGDYQSAYEELVGHWSGDKIEAVSVLPLKAAKYHDCTIDFFFSEEHSLFESGRLSRDNRGKMYHAYAAGFGKVEKKTGDSTVVVSGIYDTGSQDEIKTAFDNLVGTTLAAFNLTFESANGVVDVEIINIINGVLSVATVDEHFNYRRLGEIKAGGKRFVVGDMVKVKKQTLELVV